MQRRKKETTIKRNEYCYEENDVDEDPFYEIYSSHKMSYFEKKEKKPKKE
jgi:hypothetical protein